MSQNVIIFVSKRGEKFVEDLIKTLNSREKTIKINKFMGAVFVLVALLVLVN